MLLLLWLLRLVLLKALDSTITPQWILSLSLLLGGSRGGGGTVRVGSEASCLRSCRLLLLLLLLLLHHHSCRIAPGIDTHSGLGERATL